MGRARVGVVMKPRRVQSVPAGGQKERDSSGMPRGHAHPGRNGNGKGHARRVSWLDHAQPAAASAARVEER